MTLLIDRFRTGTLQERLLVGNTLVIAASATISIPVYLLWGSYFMAGTALLVLLLAGWMLAPATTDRHYAVEARLLAGLVAICLIAAAPMDPRDAIALSPSMPILVLFGALLAGSRAGLQVAGALAVGLTAICSGWYLYDPDPALLAHLFMDIVRIGLTTVVVWVFYQRIEKNHHQLQARMQDVAYVRQRADDLARGDLRSEEEPPTEVGLAMAHAVRSLRQLVTAIQRVSSGIDGAASEIAEGSEQVRRGATEQGAAVEESHAILESLAASARRISGAAEDAVHSAALNSVSLARVANRSSELGQHLGSIEKIARQLRDVANQSEVLALNAALQGQAAGQAGAGILHVAQRMSQLSEASRRALRTLDELTGEVRTSASATLLATEQGTRLGDASSEAARDIQSVTRDQEVALGEVFEAMSSVLQISRDTTERQRTTSTHTAELVELARELRQLAGAFQL